MDYPLIGNLCILMSGTRESTASGDKEMVIASSVPYEIDYYQCNTIINSFKRNGTLLFDYFNYSLVLFTKNI